MDPVSLITGIIIAGVIGFIAGQKLSKDNQQQKQLQKELEEKQQELEAFRQKVTQHFEKSAELFNQVSDSYQSLYEHMARGSGQLCASQTFRSLPADAPLTGQLENPNERTEYSSQSEKDLFSPDKLYNAHEYRNQAESETEQEPEDTVSERDDKVVDLEKAKEDKREPALDYAIKEKGVINHNSLDIDGVKTS